MFPIQERTSESKVYPHYMRCHEDSKKNVDYLMGRLLTLIDASVADQVQRKAMKDLMRGEFLDMWANYQRDTLACVFKGLAKEFGDSFGESAMIVGSSLSE